MNETQTTWPITERQFRLAVDAFADAAEGGKLRAALAEVGVIWHPRVKNCARITGWEGCDNEGEWHGHWVAGRPNDHPETFFTVIRHTDVMWE